MSSLSKALFLASLGLSRGAIPCGVSEPCHPGNYVNTNTGGISPSCRKGAVSGSSEGPPGSTSSQFALFGGKGKTLKLNKTDPSTGHFHRGTYNDVWTMVIQEDGTPKWTLHAPKGVDVPKPRWKSSGGTNGGSLVVFGGYSVDEYNNKTGVQVRNPIYGDVWSYKFQDDEWRQITYGAANAPASPEAMTTAFYDNTLYTFGGKTNETGIYGADANFYALPLKAEHDNDKEASWENLTETALKAGMPSRRGHGSTVIHDPLTKEHMLVVWGGRYAMDIEGDSIYQNDMWMYSFTMQRWSIVKGQESNAVTLNQGGVTVDSRNHPRPLGRDHISISALPDPGPDGKYTQSLLLFGGRCQAVPALVLNDVWRFDLRTRKWEMLSGSGNRDDGTAPTGRFMNEAVPWYMNMNMNMNEHLEDEDEDEGLEPEPEPEHEHEKQKKGNKEQKKSKKEKKSKQKQAKGRGRARFSGFRGLLMYGGEEILGGVVDFKDRANFAAIVQNVGGGGGGGNVTAVAATQVNDTGSRRLNEWAKLNLVTVHQLKNDIWVFDVEKKKWTNIQASNCEYWDGIATDETPNYTYFSHGVFVFSSTAVALFASSTVLLSMAVFGTVAVRHYVYNRNGRIADVNMEGKCMLGRGLVANEQGSANYRTI